MLSWAGLPVWALVWVKVSLWAVGFRCASLEASACLLDGGVADRGEPDGSWGEPELVNEPLSSAVVGVEAVSVWVGGFDVATRTWSKAAGWLEVLPSFVGSVVFTVAWVAVCVTPGFGEGGAWELGERLSEGTTGGCNGVWIVELSFLSGTSLVSTSGTAERENEKDEVTVNQTSELEVL